VIVDKILGKRKEAGDMHEWEKGVHCLPAKKGTRHPYIESFPLRWLWKRNYWIGFQSYFVYISGLENAFFNPSGYRKGIARVRFIRSGIGLRWKAFLPEGGWIPAWCKNRWFTGKKKDKGAGKGQRQRIEKTPEKKVDENLNDGCQKLKRWLPEPHGGRWLLV
jgi:hypothetical protein